MTKALISKLISNELGIPIDSSKDFINKFLYLIIKNSNSKKIKIGGFGTFNYHTSPERTGRNPKTLESYIIKPRKKLLFKPSKKIKGILN